MEPNQMPIANSMLVLREEFDDWAILFDPDTGDGFGLNPVSVFIWKHLDGRHTAEDIHKELCDQCEDVAGDALKDITDFIDQLLTKGYAGYEAR